ncbi:hypothetical protein J6590_096626 [Homalodisca vitripennis]|nr:hypothetical protein J6590_096626 [Homalodisca vitripennis]
MNLFDNYVNGILDGDLSEVNGFLDDEDADPTLAPIAVLERHPEDDQSSEEEVDNAVQQPAPSQPSEPQPATSSRYTWNMSNVFSPLPAVPEINESFNLQRLSPLDTFYRYVPQSLFDDMALAKSQRILSTTAKNVVVTFAMLKPFFGANIIMS